MTTGTQCDESQSELNRSGQFHLRSSVWPSSSLPPVNIIHSYIRNSKNANLISGLRLGKKEPSCSCLGPMPWDNSFTFSLDFFPRRIGSQLANPVSGVRSPPSIVLKTQIIYSLKLEEGKNAGNSLVLFWI